MQVGPVKTNPRFLVLRGGAIGDFIVTLPVLQALKDRWPECEIELVGYPHVAELARMGGLVSSVSSLDSSGMARFFARKPMFTVEQADFIRSFDLIVTYLHDPDGLVKENLEIAGARQVLYGSPMIAEGHACDQMVEPLQKLAIYAENPVPALKLSSEAKRAGRAQLECRGLKGKTSIIHPGSGSPSKNWGLSRFRATASALGEKGFNTIFVLGEADEEIANRIRDEDICIKGIPLTELASVISACDLYIGNDSGISHLSAALGIPSIVLFGPSDWRKWGPKGDHVTILHDESGALDGITVSQVIDAVEFCL